MRLRERVIGRAACDRRTVQVRNLAAEENEFPNVKPNSWSRGFAGQFTACAGSCAPAVSTSSMASMKPIAIVRRSS
jgi:hypothetical protein